MVSIHAPTRGATEAVYENAFDDKVSIHAPTRGATDSNCNFSIFSFMVSIHAPTRRATAL